MNNRKLTVALISSAILIGALSVIVGGPVHAADQSKNTVSKEFAKPLTAAREAMKRGSYQEMLEQLDKAKALPKATPWETHLINELGSYAYLKTGKLSQAAQAMEALVGDGFTTPAEANGKVKALTPIYFQLKDYGKCIDFGTRAIRGGFADASTYTAVSQSYYLKGDFKDAVKFTENWVSDETKRGEAPKESQLQVILSSCQSLQDQPCQTHTFERLVTYYPKPDYWLNLMDSLFRSKEAESNDMLMLDIYQLAYDVAAISKAQQYIEMAQLSLEQMIPCGAQQVLEKASGKNVFTEKRDQEHAQRLLNSAKTQCAAELASLPKREQEAMASATGDDDVAVGIAYLSHNQYDKATDLLAAGLMKEGNVKSPVPARLQLGIAQLKAGKRDDALKSFHKVKGDPALERLANLWSLHARGEDRTVASR
jgi:tetratricopeptide (TPR) repeat protein